MPVGIVFRMRSEEENMIACTVPLTPLTFRLSHDDVLRLSCSHAQTDYP